MQPPLDFLRIDGRNSATAPTVLAGLGLAIHDFAAKTKEDLDGRQGPPRAGLRPTRRPRP